MAGGKRFILGLCGGLAAASLGVLWSLQGAGAVHVRPILCVANCKPITEGSAGWLALGLTFLLLGIAVVGASVRGRIHRAGDRPSRRPGTDPARASGASDRKISPQP
jgi:hypothetical protein